MVTPGGLQGVSMLRSHAQLERCVGQPGHTGMRRDNLDEDMAPWAGGGFTFQDFKRMAELHPEGAEVQMLEVTRMNHSPDPRPMPEPKTI